METTWVKIIVEAAKKTEHSPSSQDIIVVTHVVVSKAERNIVNLDDVKPSQKAIEIAQKTNKDPSLSRGYPSGKLKT
jgi:coenzyme F420-0:L-glutamate ligase/coenzyme F420-1:gamma-L-glutamate ligase